jgi:hypothetical protein
MGRSHGFSQYIDFFIQAFTSATGQILFFSGMLILAYILLARKGVWMGYGMLLLSGIASLLQNAAQYASIEQNFSRPTTAFLNMARVSFTVILMVMTFRLVVGTKDLRQLRIGLSGWCLLVLQVLYALRMLLSGDSSRAILSSVMACCLVAGVLVLLLSHMQEPEDVRKLQRAIFAAGAAFVLICTYEYIRSPSSVMQQNRFTGISGNPQFAGIFLAIQSITAFSLCRDPALTRWMRMLTGAGAVIFASFVFWTGSRTGMGMLVLGVAAVNRASIMRWIRLAVILIPAFLGWITLFPQTMSNADRARDFTNTREEAFATAWRAFVKNPAFGDPQFGVIENSYLTVAASTGMIGVAILLLLVWSHSSDVVRAYRYSRRDPSVVPVVDYVIGMTIALGAGAMFEGFLLGYATASIVFVYITLALTRFIIEYAQRREAAPETGAPMLAGNPQWVPQASM